MILDRLATLDVPEVFTRPLHAVTLWNPQTDLDEHNRHTFVACRVSVLLPILRPWPPEVTRYLYSGLFGWPSSRRGESFCRRGPRTARDGEQEWRGRSRFQSTK